MAWMHLHKLSLIILDNEQLILIGPMKIGTRQAFENLLGKTLFDFHLTLGQLKWSE